MFRPISKTFITRLSTTFFNRQLPTVTRRFIRPAVSIHLTRSFHSTRIQFIPYTITELDTERYHKLADDVLEHMVSNLEEIGDNTTLPGFDIEYSQGVMTISLGEHGTYVINKQPPNHQIWLSSPISGPQRYDYDENHQTWFYHRDNHTLDQVLNEELSKVFGEKIDVLKGYEPQHH